MNNSFSYKLKPALTPRARKRNFSIQLKKTTIATPSSPKVIPTKTIGP